MDVLTTYIVHKLSVHKLKRKNWLILQKDLQKTALSVYLLIE